MALAGVVIIVEAGIDPAITRIIMMMMVGISIGISEELTGIQTGKGVWQFAQKSYLFTAMIFVDSVW